MTDDHSGRRVDVSAGEFAVLVDALSTWGRWGETDERARCTISSPHVKRRA
jgi:hypothetical protein